MDANGYDIYWNPETKVAQYERPTYPPPPRNFAQGLGIATNNVAEYRALILGLEYALDKGFRNVRIKGDSLLVCNQVLDEWRVNHPKLAELNEYAKDLMSRFNSCRIQHIGRMVRFNASLEGETQEETAGGFRRRDYQDDIDFSGK
ncbi:Uncharacterized protein Rs2_25436 [Raphanus sativus]|nr:Uncharacterized protein Rs2_25436 [Raphanus sativus]